MLLISKHLILCSINLQEQLINLILQQVSMQPNTHQSESFQDFNHRFQMAELLPKSPRGVIFIGNTRAGKSTLACAGSGNDMETIYDSEQAVTYIHPKQKQLKDKGIVKNHNQSVTQIPNFFQPNIPLNRYAVIDMPGYADSSRFRQLINFHYIQTMTKNIKEVRFLMVLMIHVRTSGFQIDSVHLRMMEAFMEMFPDCRDCVTIIVNQIEDDGKSNFDSRVKHFLREKIVDAHYLEKYVTKSSEMRKYYQPIISNPNCTVLVRRPPYRTTPSNKTWAEDNKEVKTIMNQICNNQNAKFMPVPELKGKLSLFKTGDENKNKQFHNILLNILKAIKQEVNLGLNLFKDVFIYLLKDSIKRTNSQTEISKAFKQIPKLKDIKDKPLTPTLQDIHMQHLESRLIKLFSEISNYKNLMPQTDFDKRIKLQLLRTPQLFSQLILIAKKLYASNTILAKNLNLIFSMVYRGLQQAYFIWKTVLSQKNNYDICEIQASVQNILQITYTIQIFTNHNRQQLFDYIRALMDHFIYLNLKTFLQQTKQTKLNESLKEELIQALRTIKEKDFLTNRISNESNLEENIVKKIDQKIKDIQLYFIIHIQPSSPQKIKELILNLLTQYTLTENKQIKFQIALKLAHYYQQTEQPKNAIGLYHQIQIYDKVMTLLDCITKDCKKEEAVDWYCQFANQFEKRGRYTYFQLCIERAKKYSLDNLELLIRLQETFAKGCEQIPRIPKPNKEPFDKKSLSERLEYWNWDKINEQVSFLKGKSSIVSSISHLASIVAKKLRWK